MKRTLLIAATALALSAPAVPHAHAACATFNGTSAVAQALVLAATAAHARDREETCSSYTSITGTTRHAVQMTTWGQIGIAIMELARLKARRRLRTVRRNFLARIRL